MEKISTITERPFAKGLLSFVFLNFASLVNMEVCQKIKTRKCVKCDVKYVNRFTKIGLMKQYQSLSKEKKFFRVKYGFSIDIFA